MIDIFIITIVADFVDQPQQIIAAKKKKSKFVFCRSLSIKRKTFFLIDVTT